MGVSRRALLGAAGALAFLAGCGGGGLSGPSTPPPSTFEVTVAGEHAIALRYTGIGTQDTGRFRVVLTGAGAADGTYVLASVTGDDGWNEEDRYLLNRTTLGLAEPLAVEGLTVELQYRDDGTWLTLVRTQPAD